MSPSIRAVIVWQLHAALQVRALISDPMAHGSALSHAIGQDPSIPVSHDSPGSKIALPQTAEQSESVAADAPLGQQASAAPSDHSVKTQSAVHVPSFRSSS